MEEAFLTAYHYPCKYLFNMFIPIYAFIIYEYEQMFKLFVPILIRSMEKHTKHSFFQQRSAHYSV